MPDEHESSRLFGIELEFNLIEGSAKNYDEVCRKILSVLNKDAKHVHIMKDNSVRNGIEIVFSPMTYNYLVYTFNFEELFIMFKDLGLITTHDTGFHIHVGLTHSLRERNLILRLFATSYPLWLELSNRHIIRLQDRYVSTEFFTMNDKIKNRHTHNLYSIYKKGTSFVSFENLYFENYDVYNRYNAINFTNKNTVEFRLFNGISEATSFLRILKFVKDFIALVDEISVTRIDEVFDLNTFVLRTHSKDILKHVEVRLQRVEQLINLGHLHYNYFYLIDSFWYPSISKHAEIGSYLISKDSYMLYQEYISLIKALNPSTDFHRINVFKEYLNDFMLGVTYEIIQISDETLGVVPVINTTHLNTFTKNDVDTKYQVMKCINRDFLYSFK